MNKPKRLIRPRMNNLLSSIIEFPLTIVEAPAGYGKTTAIQDYFSSKMFKPLWISFQSVCEPFQYFWEKICDRVFEIDTAASDALKNLGLPINAIQRNQMISIVNQLEFREPAIVVLDNYELWDDPSCSRLILQVAENEIDNLHIVIVTRDTSRIDFVSLLSRGKCSVISQQQIKFTNDEVREYCLLTGSLATDEEMRKIAEYTDGWISMIYILLLGLEENIPIGLNHTLDELIDKTLYCVHDYDTQHFLQQLSLMDNFTEKQAVFVTGNERAGELLKQLQKENAFILYDDWEKEYKIHNVLLDFLKEKQNFSLEEQHVLYCRLGEWYLRQSEFFKAYTYLARAGEAEKILTHLNDAAPIRDLYTDFEGADELFASVPQKLLLENPIAYLRYLFYSIVKQKKKVTMNVPKYLDELEAYYLDKKDIDESSRNYVLGEILCVRKFTMFNCIEKMHTYNDRIISLLNGRQSSIMLNVNEFTFGSPHYLYIYFRDEGSLQKVTAISQENIHVNFSDGCGMGSDSLAAAEYDCETGDFHNAIIESQKAIYKAETKLQWSIIICAKFNLIRAALALGKINTAREMLRELCNDAEKQNSAVYSSMAHLCRGYLYSSLGMPEMIPLWFKNGDMSSLSMFFGGMGFDKLVYAKTLLASGEYLKLEALSDSFNDVFSIFQNRLGFIHNAILAAAVKCHLYGANKAAPALIRALNMARPDNIVLPFAECAVHLLPIFKVLSKEDKNDAFTSHVLFICTQYNQRLKNILPQKPKLTVREMEILRLLAEGMTRNEIADKLTISPVTVKTHIQAIYRRLDADGKANAVKIARINGFL